MRYDKSTVNTVSKTIGVDLSSLLSQYVQFEQNLKQDIIDYYAGSTSNPNAIAFNTLSRLQVEFNQAISSFSKNKRRLQRNDFWALLEEMERVRTSLLTTSNASKFLRSAITKNNFNPNPLVEISLRQGQSLESLARELNAEDPNNDWTELALRNRLSEEDYDASSGNLLQVTFQGTDTLFIASIVDNIDTADKTYGRDFQKRLEFTDNDLKVLTYKETLVQTLLILTSITRGSVPEFPERGIQKGLAVGSTLGSLSFPSLFRQLYALFDTEDSLRSFAITDISREADGLILEYRVTTRAGEVETRRFSI